MRGRLSATWQDVRSSFWFIPALLAGGSIVLSFVMVEVDKQVGEEALTEFRWIMDAGADGVRSLLSTIAGSMITVAGTVFSITIIALTLASQQFGPRLLRNFMRDRGNQLVLGTFTATFLYSILVLRTVSGETSDEVFIPRLASLGAVILAVASVGVLIYFIHHVAVSIQAPYIIARVARELEEQIETLFPETLGHPPRPEEPPPNLPDGFDDQAKWLALEESGYIENIDESALIRIAERCDVIVRLRCRPGAFIVRGEPCMQVWPAQNVDDETARHLRKVLTLGRARTAEQDVAFAVDQLVEVAAKSLSPSINDPFTALACIDRLGEAFASLATRKMPSPGRLDADGKLRVVAHPFRMSELVRQSLEPIRRYGAEQIMVVLRLLDTIAIVGSSLQREEDRQVLLQEIEYIAAAGERAHADDPQQDLIAARAELARKSLIQRRPPDEDASGNPMH